MLTRRGLLKASLPILAAPAIIRVADLMRIIPVRSHLTPVWDIVDPRVISADISMWGRSSVECTSLGTNTLYWVTTDMRLYEGRAEIA